ncbi:caspase family protein [Chthonobacter rhizosphaerae]|uniref:caspase family protein n=1 Tax=Chthonobacter rhizosphaerae TaxID=2735553 RepID=UPI0015EEB093|nr:caspase family protein [Chthonobacter rhizosphaerae]
MALAVFLAATAPAAAKDWGLVVGINDYRHLVAAEETVPGQLSDLQGAVNDAMVIAESLRAARVDLPDDRVLLDASATLDAFLGAFESIKTQATAGDTIIVTFAGHGGQEHEVSAPVDETDGLDETIMFHDFDPANAREGRLNDDQLRTLLEGAAAFQVLFVMDSCHSAGLERKVARGTGLRRTGGVWDIPLDPIPGEAPSGQGDSGLPPLPNVTQILATATEDRLVQETVFEGKRHGALSWFFAKAVAGEADQNGDGALTRLEMAAYIGDRVFTHMEQNQQPRFLPRGDPSVMLQFREPASPVAEVIDPKAILVQLIGEPPPSLDLATCGCRLVPSGGAVTIERSGAGWTVYNGVGDKVTEFTGDVGPHLARAKFLLDLNAAKVTHLPPIEIVPQQSAARQPLDALVGFDFRPPTPDLVFITLFNVASDGRLQYGLYPPGVREDVPAPDGLSLRFTVVPPTGEDQLVVAWCARPPLALHALLAQHNDRLVPPMADVVAAASDTTCQFGRIGLFTEGG